MEKYNIVNKYYCVRPADIIVSNGQYICKSCNLVPRDVYNFAYECYGSHTIIKKSINLPLYISI